jgi:hypothetical protein
MEQMEKAIKGASDRERLRLPQLGNRPAQQRRQNVEAKKRDLLSDDSSVKASLALAPAPAPAPAPAFAPAPAHDLAKITKSGVADMLMTQQELFLSRDEAAP